MQNCFANQLGGKVACIYELPASIADSASAEENGHEIITTI